MSIDKCPDILVALDRLRQDLQGWTVLNHWDGDLLAVGIARENEPRRLMYVAALVDRPGRYYYECEEPSGPLPTDYECVESRDDVDVDVLVEAARRHLRL